MYKNTFFPKNCISLGLVRRQQKCQRQLEFSLALKLERNNSQHLQNIPLLLEINYLYKKLHASTIAFIFSTTQGFNPSAITRNRFIVLYKWTMWHRNRSSHNHRKILTRVTSDMVYFNSIFFSQANISFPFVICF